MSDTDSAARASIGGGTLWRLLMLSLGLGAFYLLAQAFRLGPCSSLFFVLAATAFPIWYYQRDVVLFKRRVILAGVAKGESRIRRWLWAGRLTQFIQVFVSLFWAALLLALTHLMEPEHWYVLALDTLLLSLIVDPVRRRLAGEIHDEKLGVVSRAWPLMLINVAFLALAFLAVDFLVGNPDTRSLMWKEVAEQSFEQARAGYSCVSAGWLAGALAAVDALSWHASQLIIPSLPDSSARLLAWAVVLLHAGLLAYLFSRVQLGFVALQERFTRREQGESMLVLAFVYTILLLAVPYFYLSHKLSTTDFSKLGEGARQVVAWSNPCGLDSSTRDQVLSTLSNDLDSARRQARADADTQVDVVIERLFKDVEGGVDAYLDWYFTVVGEYQRLAAAAVGNVGELMSETLEQKLFGDTKFGERLGELNQTIAEDSLDSLLTQAGNLGDRARAEMRAQPCALEGLNLTVLGDLQRDQLRATVAGGGGIAAGAVTAKLLAKKTGAAVVGKVAAKKGFQAAAGLLGKASLKKGGSILLSAASATALCAPGGPLAVFCGIVAGTVTWLAVDKAMVEIDEALFRDELKAELMTTLAEQKSVLTEALKLSQGEAIDATAAEIQQRVERIFVPARDGI